MIKKVIFGIIVTNMFVSTLLGMEPDICPRLPTDHDVNYFIHQLGTTAKPKGQEQQFSFWGKQWLIPQDSYALLNGSVSFENAQVISQEPSADYVVIEHIEYSKNESVDQKPNSPATRCFYSATGKGRKTGQPTAINKEFYITNFVQEEANKSSVAANPIHAGEKKLVTKITTTLGADVHAFSNNEIVYQWDTFYQTEAYKDAKPGEQITDNFVVPTVDKANFLLVREQIKKGNNEEESRTTQVQAVNKILSRNIINGKLAGVIYDGGNGQESYYGGFWRDHQAYKEIQPDQNIKERFNIAKVCGIGNGQKLCVNNVSDVIIKKPANNWQLPIPVSIINYSGAKQALIIPSTLPQGANVNISKTGQ